MNQMMSDSVWDGLPPLSSGYVWLVSHNFEASEQIFYNVDKSLFPYRCRVPELVGRRIRANFHGWVILSSYPRVVMWSLWNPLTRKLIRLPPLNHEHAYSHMCCLSAPVGDPSSVFLLITAEKPSIVFCRLDRKRKRYKWTEMSYANQVKNMSIEEQGQGCVLESPTCCNGKVYALTRGANENYIMQIDIVVKDKEVVITLLPFLVVPYPRLDRSHFNKGSSYFPFLKGTCTELFFTVVEFKGVEPNTTICDVFLFKLDMTSMGWEEMKDLKDSMFFIECDCGYSVFYKPSVASELGGYVHIFGENRKVMYSYHIKDRTIFPSSMPCVVRESQGWAMLEFRLEGDHVNDSKQREDLRDDTGIDVRLFRDNEITGNSPLLDIPFHLLEKIMEHCVGVEYMNFRITCKECRLAAPLIKWRSNKIALRRLHMYSLVSPWLMLWDRDRGIITCIDPMGGDRYFFRTTSFHESTADHHIYWSRYGWLLMYKLASGSPVLFNPFTNVLFKLPRIFRIARFCFSAPPTCSDCMVVGFDIWDECYEWEVSIHYVAREQSWLRFTVDFGGGGVKPCSLQFPTFHGRDLYALCNDGGIGVFRLLGEEEDYSLEYGVFKAPLTTTTTDGRVKYFLANCDEHILLVILGEFGESLELFNLNESTLKWEKMEGLGKHMVYISDTTCVCTEAKLPEMENKIYFSRLLHTTGNEKVVVYSFETCRFHTFNGKNIEEGEGFENLFRTIYYCYPQTWIEPSWSS